MTVIATGVTIDWTVSIGTLLAVVVTLVSQFLFGVVAFKVFQTKTQLLFENQGSILTSLSTRLNQHEQRDEELFEKVQDKLGDLVGGVSRLVGQNDAFRRSSRGDGGR